MLRDIESIMDYSLQGKDGDIGKVKDLFFDEESWTLRYLIVKTGSWLNQSRVMLSVQSVAKVSDEDQVIHVDATKEEVEESPGVEMDVPISRESELFLLKYWQWAPYWQDGPVPTNIGESVRHEADEDSLNAVEDAAESHLRSVTEIRGYHVQAKDGEIGHVEDLIAETDNWAVRYAVIDTRNWLPGKHILLSPEWIDEIRWSREVFVVDTTRDAIRQAPEYDDSEPITREYETRLHDHFAQDTYWDE